MSFPLSSLGDKVYLTSSKLMKNVLDLMWKAFIERESMKVTLKD